jgi:flavin reductase (DIM6/NTAB) family NADH-FMN oxidoreductase RutF
MNRKKLELEKVHRLFYPQVPVLVTVEYQGRIGGMPAIWCMPLSFKPPKVAVSIAPEHETYGMINGTKSFGLNWLDYSHAKQLAELGETSGKEHRDKLSAVGLTTVRGRATSQPLVREALATLECRVEESIRVGTHQLLICDVVDAEAGEEFGDYWDFSKYHPLLYAGTKNGDTRFWLFISTRGERTEIPLK